MMIRAGRWGMVAVGTWLVVLVGMGLGLAVDAQQPAGGGTGTVTGHVIAQDTQRPARFATVMLQSVASAASTSEGTNGRFAGGGTVNSRTDVEGNFTALNVEPGDYYVTAMAPGYVPERALLQAGLNAGATPAALLAQIPVVRVTMDSVTSVVVTMERGAVVSGRVQWEDGSAASGLAMRAIPPTATGGVGLALGAGVTLPAALQGIQSPGGASGFGVTDDRGAFRIAGLAPGEYVVQATIPPSSQSGGAGNVARFSSPVMVYSPGVFRKSMAKTITVNRGEERSDVRMVMDLRGLHTVSGHVTSTDAAQSVASGRVSLSDPNDRDLRVTATIGPDGGFALQYVPPGSFTLQVSAGSSQSGGGRGRESQGTGVSFQPGTQTVTVADRDVTDVAIALTPVQATQ